MNAEKQDASVSTQSLANLFSIGLDPHHGMESWQPPSVEELQFILPSTKYRVESFVARGGMGAVYRCRHLLRDKLVAIKLLHPLLALDSTFEQRFKAEVNLLDKINHPGIVKVYDLDHVTSSDIGVPGCLYMVMDFVEGESLQTLFDHARKQKHDQQNAEQTSASFLPPNLALKLTTQICEALSIAHTVGIIHRDIKPSNIIVTPEESIVLVDFGVARKLDARNTLTGQVAHTPHYVAPERLSGSKNDPHQREDIYSLGVLLYEMFTGRLPTAFCPNPSEFLRHSSGPWKSLDKIVRRAMEQDPAKRYQHISELKDDLHVILEATCGIPPTCGPLGGDANAPTTIPEAISSRRYWILSSMLPAVGLFYVLLRRPSNIDAPKQKNSILDLLAEGHLATTPWDCNESGSMTFAPDDLSRLYFYEALQVISPSQPYHLTINLDLTLPQNRGCFGFQFPVAGNAYYLPFLFFLQNAKPLTGRRLTASNGNMNCKAVEGRATYRIDFNREAESRRAELSVSTPEQPHLYQETYGGVLRRPNPGTFKHAGRIRFVASDAPIIIHALTAQVHAGSLEQVKPMWFAGAPMPSSGN